ncbi:MAG: adenylate/guanylate cyclase domain-containing protein [Lachnospiraceae bacterium]
MEKIVWVISNNKEEMISTQRLINSTGSMRAVCLLSFSAVQKVALENVSTSRFATPSLILLDYEMSLLEDFTILYFLKKQQSVASVPLFFMASDRDKEIDRDCYEKGAMVILTKPLSQTEILRIERTAWQHEVTKNYEKMLQKQASELQAAKEIHQLNQKLEARNKLLYQVFGRYFSDQVVDVILDHSEGDTIRGEKREVTVLMTDLRGFTSLAECLSSDGVTDLLNYYFSRMTEVINHFHGTVIEFLGDAVLAVFGAPVASDRQTEEAVCSAITMQNAMGKVNTYCMEKGYPLLEMGIGIHRGEAFVGNIGSEDMMRYNVIGRVVNECSRIQSYSVGGQVLVSESTLEKVNCPVVVPNKMDINAKGMHHPVCVCEVTGIQGEYECNIENVDFDVMCPCEEWVVFNLYVTEGKHVSDISVSGKLLQVSKKRAVVKLLDEVKKIDVFSDVEIFAATNEGKAVFTGVYAKVIDRTKRKLTLHFTHTNDSFERFVDEVRLM